MAIPVLVTALLDLDGRPVAGRRTDERRPTAEAAGPGRLPRLAAASAAMLQSIGLILVDRDDRPRRPPRPRSAGGSRLGEAWAAHPRASAGALIGLTLLLGLMLLGLLAAVRADLGAGRAGRRTLAVAVVYGLVSVPLFLALLVLVLDPGLLPAGARADARARRRLRGPRPRLPPDPRAVLADLRHRAADRASSRSVAGHHAQPADHPRSASCAARRRLQRVRRPRAGAQPGARARWSRPPSSRRSPPRSPPCSTSTSGCARRRYDVELMAQAGITAR